MPRFVRTDERDPRVERERAEKRMRECHLRQRQAVRGGDRVAHRDGRAFERCACRVGIEPGRVQNRWRGETSRASGDTIRVEWSETWDDREVQTPPGLRC